MNILLTGSTAAHVSATKNEKTKTFMGDVYKALTYSKNRVTWVEPSVFMSLDYVSDFDAVIVGLAPPTSTSAHRIYGALSVIGHAISANNLFLVVDAPEPKKIWYGLKSIQKNPESLFKSFYSKRKEYKETEKPEIFSHMLKTVHYLVNNEWPKTLFPSFPWMSFSSVSSYIPQTSSSNLVGLCFDEKHLLPSAEISHKQKPKNWLSDKLSSPWTKKQEKLLSLPVLPVRASRWASDSEVEKRLSDAVGCLISTYESGDPWWSPALSQCLSCGTPVVSDWTLTSILGNSWTYLPQNLEEMRREELYNLANDQLISYKNSIPKWDISVELLQDSINN
jgi:hypothetical protein